MRGGARPGAGRKPGGMNPTTLHRKAVSEAITQRILRDADALYLAQRTLAVGSLLIFRIDEGPKGGRPVHTLVEDPTEILNLINQHGGPDVSTGGIVDGKFYFFATRAPDNRALDSLMNRGLGKVPEHVKHETVDPKDLAKELLEELQVEPYNLPLDAARKVVQDNLGDVLDGEYDQVSGAVS